MTERRKDGTCARAAISIAGLLSLSVIPSFRLSAQDTLPVGLGTLRRDDIAVRFATGEIELQVLPLDEEVIRLLAPDTYRALTSLLESRRAELDTAAARAAVRDPTLVLVTFFGVVPQARFTPDDIEITSRSRLFRPAAIVPLSPAWSSLQLEARQQAAAIYLFEDGISLRETLTVSYQGRTNDSWARSASALERERARVMARVRAQPSP
jgi:hypothetical protein